MAEQSIGEYIETLRKNNISDDQIKQVLLDAGWQEKDIVTAMYPVPSVQKSDILTPPKPPGQGSASMWDAFEHILLFISLYVMAISITLILHTFVDHWVPDVSRGVYGYMSSIRNTILRGYMSALIVSYPIFVFFFWRVTKRTIQHTFLRSLKSRKFLIYLTLVVTFLIMLGFIIATINSLLNGNITLNFLLHLIVTLGVSGTIFTYYLHQVKEDRQYA